MCYTLTHSENRVAFLIEYLSSFLIGCYLFLQFLEPLELCHRSLCACGDRPIADGSLLDFLQQVSTFGLSLVRLDIRQESDRHTDVIDAITLHLEIGPYRERPEQKGRSGSYPNSVASVLFSVPIFPKLKKSPMFWTLSMSFLNSPQITLETTSFQWRLHRLMC